MILVWGLALTLTTSQGASARTEAAKQSQQAADAGLDAVLQELSERAGDVQDLSAKYEERKHTVLLKEPLVTRGQVRILHDKARWDAETPHETVTLLDPKEVRLYYPDRQTVEVYPIARHLQFPAVSPLPDWKELKEHFRIEPRHNDGQSPQGSVAAVRLRLTPLRPGLRDYVETVDVAIDRSSGLLRSAEITDPDGDRTIMTFSDIRANTGLSARDLDLQLPAGTRITYPVSAEPDPSKPAGD